MDNISRPARGFLKHFMLKLISDKPRSGYEIMNVIEEISGKRPSAGSIYPLLQELEEKGFIKGETKNKKIEYTITEGGKKALEELEKKQKDILGSSISSFLRTYSTIFGDKEIEFVSKQMDFYNKISKFSIPEKIWIEFSRFRRDFFDLLISNPDEEIKLLLEKILRNANIELEELKKRVKNGIRDKNP